jgi:hypothetical protein
MLLALFKLPVRKFRLDIEDEDEMNRIIIIHGGSRKKE